MKNKIKYIVRIILAVGIVIFLGLIICTNIETRKTNKSSPSSDVNNQEANIEAEKDIKYSTEIIKDTLSNNNTDMFTIGDRNSLGKNKSLDNYEDKVLIFINCNIVKNKGMNFKIDSLKKNNGDFYITYEYSLPQSNSVIGEINKKDNILISISMNDLKYGNNNFVFMDKNANGQPILLTYKKERINPSKTGVKLINPATSNDNKYVAYIGNQDYSWNLYVYDITNKKTKVMSEKYFFKNINDTNDDNYSNFPEYVWTTDNDLIYTNGNIIERVNVQNGSVGEIYNPKNGGKLSRLIYSANVKGIYFIETTGTDKSNIKFIAIDSPNAKSICIEHYVISNISISPKEDQIAYIIYDSSKQKNRYSVKTYNLINKKTTEVYEGDCISEIGWLDNDNVVFPLSGLKSSYNNLYSIKTNQTNFRQITRTEDVTYLNINTVGGKIYFTRNYDTYKELWVINGSDINKVSTGKIVGNYVINQKGTIAAYSSEDYSLFETNLVKEAETKLLSSKVEVEK